MEKKKKKMMNRVQHVVLAVIIMALMNSGSVVICVKDGSMVNVLKLLLLRLSTSSNTSALAAVTRGLEFESSKPLDQSPIKQTRFRMFDNIFTSENCFLFKSMMHFNDYADGISSFATVHYYCLIFLGIVLSSHWQQGYYINIFCSFLF